MAVELLCLALFWAGILLLASKERWDLKARAQYYIGKGRAYTQKSALAEGIREISLNRKKEQMVKELSECLAYVNNMVVLGRGKSISAQLLLTELAEFSRALSPVFLNMVHSLNVNEVQKAKEALYDAIGTAYSMDIGSLLAGWDELPPEEMESTCAIYTAALRDEREARLARRDEMISDLIYFPAVANAMLVMLDFVYVAFFIQQREALAMFL